VPRHRILVSVLVGLLQAPAWSGDQYEALPIPNTFILSSLTPQADAPADGSAFARVDIAKDGTESMVVRVIGLPAGEYEVYLGSAPGGTLKGPLSVDESGMGQMSPPPPTFGGYFKYFQNQEVFQVRQSGQVLFTDTLDPPTGMVLLDDDVSSVNGARLIAVGDDLDARGVLVYRSSFGMQRVDVRLARLTPGPYVVEIGGEDALILDVDAKGKATLQQRVPVKPGFGEITVYDVVGAEVRVRDADGAVVLAARLPYDPFEEWSRPPSRQKFRDVGHDASDGLRVDFVKYGYNGYGGLDRGWLSWERDAAGAASVTVRIVGQDFIPAEPYGVFVADELIGTVGESGQWHDFNITNTFPLGPEVDLRAQRVEVRDGAEIGLVLTYPQSVPAGVRSYHAELRQPNHLHLDLLNPGTDLDATGLVDWKRTGSGAERLRLVVRDLPTGAYDLVLDGRVVATGALVVEEDGGSADALYTTTGEPDGALMLDFDLHGGLQIAATGTSTVFLQQDLLD